jgi:hypothetical protein
VEIIDLARCHDRADANVSLHGSRNANEEHEVDYAKICESGLEDGTRALIPGGSNRNSNKPVAGRARKTTTLVHCSPRTTDNSNIGQMSEHRVGFEWNCGKDDRGPQSVSGFAISELLQLPESIQREVSLDSCSCAAPDLALAP